MATMHKQILRWKKRIRVSKEIKAAWEKQALCHCGLHGCSPKTHRLCPECHKIMIFNSYFMNPDPTYQNFRWRVELITPPIWGGKDIPENRQAVHLSCSSEKGKQFCLRRK